MAKKNAPSMNVKAANFGDRLKHSLLLETLEHTRTWANLLYAETHAGAGIYHAGGQLKNGYIDDLRQKVEDAGTAANGTGAIYLSWLKEWWSDRSNRDSYPGSALTVYHRLRHHRPDGGFDIRLTERDEATCVRLRAAFGSHAYVRQKSFSTELDWLTAADSLLLLVDPFGCVTSFGDTGSGRGLDDGWIDHATIREILSRCAKKGRAVVSFWWGYGQKLRDQHKPMCSLLNEWTQQTNSACRVFHDKRNHANALVGIGDGAAVVRGLPNRTRWKTSWLNDNVYERR